MCSKFTFLLLIFSASVLSLNCQTLSDDAKVKPCKFMSFAEAEKILGRRVEIVANSWNFTREATRIECTYRAVEKDERSGKGVNLFFLVEESSTEEQAKQTYARIWESNKNHRGIEPLSELGDEAYFHSDRENFQFLMARKGKFSIRFKIAKAPATASPEELKAFARRVIEQL